MVPAVRLADFSEGVGRAIDNATLYGTTVKEDTVSQFIRRGSGYSEDAFAADLRGMVRRARLWIPDDVDTLVGTGLSGTLVVPHLGRRLGLHWGILRKPSDMEACSSHAVTAYEGTMGRRWALVDDFVCFGDTLTRVWRQVHEEFTANKWGPWTTEFQGVFQYSSTRKHNSWVSRDAALETRYWDIKDPTVQHRPEVPATVQPPAEPQGAVFSTPSPGVADH